MHSHLEFLGQFSTETNKLFQLLLRFVEVQDIVTQFAHFRTNSLIGFKDLPQSVIVAITNHLKSIPNLALTIKALEDGFPLLINPISEYQHTKRNIMLSTLVTLPRLESDNSFCTLEKLKSLQYKVNDKCYTGPLLHNDLLLISCLNNKLVLRASSLLTCFSKPFAVICPSTILKSSNDSDWLGLPWTPNTKIDFDRSHIEIECDPKAPVLYHLGGRYYLSTTTQNIELSIGNLQMQPLSIYNIPCNETNPLLQTGFGYCPSTLQVSIPIFQKINVQYTPWTPPTNDKLFQLHYKSLNIPPPLKFNKSKIQALDQAFSRLDGLLHIQIQKIKRDIDLITETQATSAALYVAITGLSLATVNTIIMIIFSCCYFKLKRASLKKQPQIVTFHASHEKVNIPELNNTENNEQDQDCCPDCSQPLESEIIMESTENSTNV